MDSSTVDLLLGKIVSILENKALLLSGVRDEIDAIKLELHSMKAFLEDADRRGVHSKTENAWVSSVRDMAYEVEDIIDEFMYHVHKQQQRRGITGFLLKGIQYPQDLWLRHKVAVKLQDINKRIKSIPERNQRYGVSNFEGKDKRVPSNYDATWLKNHSESSLFLQDDDLVGIDKAQKELLGWLKDEELQRTVISVFGMGGLGKTTLVANTFNKQTVKQHFQCCAWITVSQQYAIEELLKSMIKQVYKKANEETPVNLNTMSFIELGDILREFLLTRRYLIVFDDVWSTNFWQDISKALPTNKNGSRILLTTRREDVADDEFGVVKHVLPLKPLTDDADWMLFCRKAFASNRGQCPQYLNSLARNLVAKCEGLPLAIVALGGLMASKKSMAQWNRVYDYLHWELNENDKFERLKYISLLSYHDLPYRLKLCFLYCCIFPEDYEIKRKRLIRLWMAEGFVEPLQETTPEVVAERYLAELICRGLLQVVTRNESGRPKRCKMHDILRELALSIAEAEKFVAKSDGKEEVGDSGIRRLSIEAKGKELKVGKGMSRLRSLFLFAVDDISSFNRLPSGFHLLTVLDLEDAPISELPGELVNLFNLRYLNITRTQVKELPNSIGKLHNLQFLVIRETQIKELPPGIVKLKNLQYLIAYRYNLTPMVFEYALGTDIPSNICSLKSLQVLSFVEARGTLIKQLSSMTQLKRLDVTNVKEADEKNLCFSIGKLRLLHTITLMSCNEGEQLKMDALESAPPNLENLVLVGKLEKVPHWFNSLHNLTFLSLHWSRLREDFLPHIQALPNLAELALVNAYEGERLCFLEGFQKLKLLRIWKCSQLKQIVIERGVMPGLQELEICECQELVNLPHGRESLPDLKEVRVIKPSSKIVEEICGAPNMDQPTISAIFSSRVEDPDEKSKFRWVHRTYDW